MKKTVTVLLSGEVDANKTVRCVEIGVVTITGTPLEVAFISHFLRDKGFDVLDIAKHRKIYEECEIALQEFGEK